VSLSFHSHVTTAGTVGTFWFVPEEANGCCSSAVRDSYVRSLTTSFGSICFGSLIVAIIQAVKEMVHSMRENGDSFVACCAECILGCIESLVEYFNKWAYVRDVHAFSCDCFLIVQDSPAYFVQCDYVGLYGMSFIEAGSSVMTLFRNRGWTAIIADMMVDTVLMMVSFGVGAITAVCAVLFGAAVSAGDSSILVIAGVLGFILGYVMSATFFSVVSSAVNTVIVCFAESRPIIPSSRIKCTMRGGGPFRTSSDSEFRIAE
jgi:Plasma-membrane choline transporter